MASISSIFLEYFISDKLMEEDEICILLSADVVLGSRGTCYSCARLN